MPAELPDPYCIVCGTQVTGPRKALSRAGTVTCGATCARIQKSKRQKERRHRGGKPHNPHASPRRLSAELRCAIRCHECREQPAANVLVCGVATCNRCIERHKAACPECTERRAEE